MTDRVRCDSCKQMVLTEWPHSCYDAAKVIAVQDAERKVVAAAEAFGADPWRGDLEGTVIGVSMEYDANGQYVLYEDVLPIVEAVRALRAAREGR